jgi:Legume lectin domain
MKVGITRFILMAVIAAVAVVAGSSAAWAQSCPTSPNYTPDFSSNQSCVTLNGTNPGYPGFYTAVSGTGTVLRLTQNTTFTAGSAWYTTQQPVSGAFSTTFTFQLSGGNTGDSPADGIAFLIQNSGTSALGPDGCGIGFGDSSSGCTPPTGGITNSLAIELNTYLNQGVDTSNNDVTIQNCSGTGPNSVDPSCTVVGGVNNNLPSTMADGNVHTMTINYSGPATKLLDVILDNTDLFPGGVVFDLTTLGLTSGNAWVGFTAATGGGDDNQDILSWTFTPQAQTAVVSTNQVAILSFPNAGGQNVYDYNALLTAQYPTPVIQIQPILMTQAACDALVQKNFWPARCFVYQNAENSGLNAAVMFSVTCPSSPGGTCGSNTDQDFFAELGTDFQFSQSENPYFTYPGVIGLLNPFPGWLKGQGPNPVLPCTPPQTGPLFQSNQIDFFTIDGGVTKGKSQGGASCWVATYDTPGEAPPGIKITSPTFTTYTKGQVVPAAYTCYNPFTSQPLTSPTGPYLTAASCTQATGTENLPCTQTGSGLSCTGTVDTSTRGVHLFTVTGIDSGGNTNVAVVLYNVK